MGQVNVTVLDGVSEAVRSTVISMDNQYGPLDSKDLLPHLNEALGEYAKAINNDDASGIINALIKLSSISSKGAKDYIDINGIRFEVG